MGKNVSEKKSHSAEKNERGDPLGLARYGMLRGKTGKTFLFQFVWIEKKVTIIVAFHFMKRRIKSVSGSKYGKMTLKRSLDQ